MDKNNALCKILDVLTHPRPGSRDKIEVKQKTARVSKGLEDLVKSVGVSDVQIDVVTRILRFNTGDSKEVYCVDIRYGYGTSTIRDSRLGLYIDVFLNSDFANEAVVRKLVSDYKLPCKEVLSKDFYYFFEEEGINVRFFDVDYYRDLSG